MHVCPFCHTAAGDPETFCQLCGYTFVPNLPRPLLVHKRFYLGLSLLSIFLGILACIFTFFSTLYLKSIFLFIIGIVLAGVSLEKAQGKSDALPVKILAVIGLVFGALGYIFFMFIHSSVPGIGYSM